MTPHDAPAGNGNNDDDRRRLNDLAARVAALEAELGSVRARVAYRDGPFGSNVFLAAEHSTSRAWFELGANGSGTTGTVLRMEGSPRHSDTNPLVDASSLASNAHLPFVVLQLRDRTFVRNVRVPLIVAIPVALTATAGAIGTSTSASTWVYDMFALRHDGTGPQVGLRLASNQSPAFSRAVGPRGAASHGLAWPTGKGEWRLFTAFEQYMG